MIHSRNLESDSRVRLRHIATVVILSCAALVTTNGHAAPNDLERAKALYKEAEVHFGLGEFDQALEKYQEAYRAKSLPGFLFNIGQCFRNLGDCDKALFNYRQYLVRMPDAYNREDVESLIEKCEVEVEAKREEERAAAEAAAIAAETERQQQQLSAQPVEAGEPPTTWLGLTPWVWTGIGVSTGLLAAGIVTGVMALSKSSEYKDPDTSIPRRQDLRDSGQTLATTSTVLVSLGAAAAVGTAALWWFTRPSRYEANVAIDPASSSGMVTFGGRF